MKKTFLLLAAVLVVCITNAQNDKAQNYINMYREAAMTEMLRSGVPASITLAQGILESGMGESELCKKSNNHFGIKCKNDWTGDKTYHDDDEKGECFRVYASAYESYKDHSDFLLSRQWYAFLFKLDPTDFEGWAHGLKKAGYATEKNYPKQLIDLINRYDLQQYSLLALQRKQGGSNDIAVTNVEEPAYIKKEVEKIEEQAAVAKVYVKPTAADSIVVKREEEPEEKPDMETATTAAGKPLEAVIAAETKKYPDGVFTINHSKVVYVKKGTSILALANQYDMSFGNLLSYNDLTDIDVLEDDMLVFLDRKLKKGAADSYTAKDGETLHSIAQTQGVRLESILEYNKLTKTSTIAAGQKIQLRPIVTAPAAKKTTATKTTAKS